MNETNGKLIMAKSEQTKAKIIDVFLGLTNEKKWDKISVKELCAAMGITRGTFYQYYNDIYDLMEQIEDALIADLNHRYQLLPLKSPSGLFPPELFDSKYDYSPPQELFVWFDFCQNHQKAVSSLLDSKYGDAYFVKKLKVILDQHINHIMDYDGMPRDGLREHFTKIFIELHFMAARTWLESKEEDFLSIREIINLLNTMRVGAGFLSNKQVTSPEFEKKMKFPADREVMR